MKRKELTVFEMAELLYFPFDRFKIFNRKFDFLKNNAYILLTFEVKPTKEEKEFIENYLSSLEFFLFEFKRKMLILAKYFIESNELKKNSTIEKLDEFLENLEDNVDCILGIANHFLNHDFYDILSGKIKIFINYTFKNIVLKEKCLYSDFRKSFGILPLKIVLNELNLSLWNKFPIHNIIEHIALCDKELRYFHHGYFENTEFNFNFNDIITFIEFWLDKDDLKKYFNFLRYMSIKELKPIFFKQNETSYIEIDAKINYLEKYYTENFEFVVNYTRDKLILKVFNELSEYKLSTSISNWKMIFENDNNSKKTIEFKNFSSKNSITKNRVFAIFSLIEQRELIKTDNLTFIFAKTKKTDKNKYSFIELHEPFKKSYLKAKMTEENYWKYLIEEDKLINNINTILRGYSKIINYRFYYTVNINNPTFHK